MPLTNYSLDKFVGPELLKFTKVSIPPSPRDDGKKDWLLNFVLSSMLGVKIQQPHRA
jgi:hypothetical protein